MRAWHSVVLAAGTALVVLTAAFGFTPALGRVVDDHDALLFWNFHEREAANGRSYRWSKGGQRRPERASTLVLPQVGRGPGVLELRVWTPEDQPPVPLTLTNEGAALLATAVQGHQTVTATLAASVLAGGDLRVGLASPGWTRRKDPRVRGAAVEGVRWTPTGWTLPPERQVWLLPTFAAAVALLLLRLGYSPSKASGGAAAIGGILALAAALRPLEVAPYTHGLLFMVGLAHLALLLWATLLRSSESPAWILPREVRAAELLLLMGVGYWTFLLGHLLLCAATGTICPTDTARGVGAAVLVGLLVIVPTTQARTRSNLGLIVLAAGGLAQAIGAALAAFRRPGVDFVTLWTAARNLSQGGSLYDVEAVLTNHFGTVFKVPPFYGMLLLPFAKMDLRSALLVHRGLDLTLYVATAGTLAVIAGRILGACDPALPRSKSGGRLLALASVCTVMGLMQPPFDTIAYGQIDIVLLVLLLLAFRGLQRGWPALVGVGVALGGLLKLYPVLLLALLLARREWRAIVWTVALLVLLTGVAMAVVGWPDHLTYATRVLPHIGGGTGWVENQTVNGFLCRLRTGTVLPRPVHEPTIDLLTYASLAVALTAATLLAARTTDRPDVSALQFSLFPLLMVLAVPAAWIHYETIVIFPLLALIWSAAVEPFSPGEAFVGALGFGLVAYGNQWSFFDGTWSPGLPLLALSRQWYGLLLLFGLTFGRIRRSPAGAGVAKVSHGLDTSGEP